MEGALQLSLGKLLNAHEQFRELTPLKENIGDGYLYHMNPAFKNVRDAAESLGLKFASNTSKFWPVFPLAGLQDLLQDSTVRYVDNYAPLAHLEALRPGVFFVSQLPTFQKNYLLHESAHIIADRLLPRLGAVPAPADEAGRRRYIALCLAAESFANTTEAMARIYVDCDIHRAFFELNSYVAMKSEFREQANQSIDFLGHRGTFLFVFAGYLMSNFLFESINRKGVELILSVVEPGRKVTAKEVGILHKLLNNGVKLSLRFRLETATFYMKLLGFQFDNIEKFLGFGFLELLFKNAEIREGIEALADVLRTGAQCEAIRNATVGEVAKAA